MKPEVTPNSEAVRLKRAGDIAWIEFDLPGEKVNKLSSGVMVHFENVIDELAASGAKVAILISRKPGIFIAGADIEEIKGIKSPEEASDASRLGQEIFTRLEKVPMPTIAAVHGACLGGGCEMILACDYRIATDDPSTKIGLPETQLGIIPGFGGTQRLPRLVGLQAALDIILAGKSVPAKKALKIGLIDQCVSKEILEDQAMKLAQNLITKGATKRTKKYEPKTIVDKVLASPLGRRVVFSKAREALLKQTRGKYPAPEKALWVVQRTYGGDLEKGLQIEAEAFGEVASTDVSKNLIHIFYMTEAVKKQTGAAKEGVTAHPVKALGVLGAGTMGGGIAQLAAEKGIVVRLKDINFDAIARGLKAAAEIFEKSVQRKRIDKYEFQRKMNLISGGLNYSGFKTLDVVIEAIVEDMNVKKKVLAETEGQCHDHAILASNTSSLSITEMATALKRPENFVGMHFFNPVHRMPLVEVIRGAKTGDEAAATIFTLAKKMGKTPIVVKDGPGFLVNRLLMPYLNEACYVLGEGGRIETIDKACLDFGMPMGPLHLIDEIGIDVCAKVAKILNHAFGERAEAAPLMHKVVEAKKLGKKNRSGFYLYDEKGKKDGVDPQIYDVLGTEPRDPMKPEDIVKRVLYPMVNEAALCLEEGIVATPEAVDLGMIMGTGFPPFRGGLLRWADTIGAAKIVDELEEMAARNGARFKPTTPFRNMAKTNRRFYS